MFTNEVYTVDELTEDLILPPHLDSNYIEKVFNIKAPHDKLHHREKVIPNSENNTV
jgi:hypothetical protein